MKLVARCICGRRIPEGVVKRAVEKKANVRCSECKSSLNPNVLLRYFIGAACGVCLRTIRKMNPHSVDLCKISALRDLHELHRCGYTRVMPSHEIGGVLNPRGGPPFQSIKNVREHIQRLSYFDLVDVVRGRGEGGYAINERGVQFLKGFHSVPKVIWCIDGRVVERSDAEVSIKDVDHAFTKTHWDSYSSLTRCP